MSERESLLTPIELGVARFWKRLRGFAKLGFARIKAGAQCSSRTIITNQLLPSSITIELRQKLGQISDQLFAFGRRKLSNRCFDFLNSAHSGSLTSRGKPGNLLSLLSAMPVLTVWLGISSTVP